MEKKFIEFFARILEKDVSEVSMELSYADGAWDSLMHIRLVAEIFEEYDVDIPIDEVAQIKTVRDFYHYVEAVK